MIPPSPEKTYLISRTDAIGDVVLTLPLAGWLKQYIPGARVLFLGRTYTAPVVSCCRHVDAFLNWDDISKLTTEEQVRFFREQNVDTIIHVFPHKTIANVARKARIPQQIGTRNRWFHWLTVTHLVAVSRRHSLLHESQLNLALLRPLGLARIPLIKEVATYLDLSQTKALPSLYQSWLKPGAPHIILHPKSRGHGREWSLAHYGDLAKQLHQQGWQVFVSGAQHEHDLLQEWLMQHAPWVTDITGKLTLPEFISFMRTCNGLVGSGTGPLHIAAALGIHALGIFPPIKPLHPGRWAPIGEKAEYLVLDKECAACRNKPAACVCINQLTVAVVVDRVLRWR